MARIRGFFAEHPRLVIWVILSVGMSLILAFTARDAELAPQQFAALWAMTLALAGLTSWIVFWE